MEEPTRTSGAEASRLRVLTSMLSEYERQAYLILTIPSDRPCHDSCDPHQPQTCVPKTETKPTFTLALGGETPT
jgi:hypothetical protein